MNYEILDNQNIIKHISFKLGKSIGWLVHSRKKNYGIAISHPNLNSDYNGIKIFSSNLERFPVDEKCILRHLISSDLFPNKDEKNKNYVFIGNDNRNTSNEIKYKLIKGIKSINENITIIDYEYATTPIISFSLINNSLCEDLYYEKFTNLQKLNINFNNLVIDCAYGIGGVVLKKILKYLYCNLVLLNHDEKKWHRINFRCGVSHVLKYSKFPLNWDNYTYGCSLNCDASQVIFYFFREKFNILDGDYIAALYMKFISSLNLEKDLKIFYLHKIDANRSILNFMNQIDIKTKVVKSNFSIDKESHISLLFDTDGKGKVFFNNIDSIKNKKLFEFASLVNSITSDGVTNIFGVLFCLSHLKIGFIEWYNFFIKEKSVSYQIEIRNTSHFIINDSNKLISPKNIQRKIDDLMVFYSSFCIIIPYKDYIYVYIESDKYLNVMKEKVNELLMKYDNYLNK